jgi:hypothetical protein
MSGQREKSRRTPSSEHESANNLNKIFPPTTNFHTTPTLKECCDAYDRRDTCVPPFEHKGVEKMYKTLARIAHPDKNPIILEKRSEQVFKRINQCRDKLLIERTKPSPQMIFANVTWAVAKLYHDAFYKALKTKIHDLAKASKNIKNVSKSMTSLLKAYGDLSPYDIRHLLQTCANLINSDSKSASPLQGDAMLSALVICSEKLKLPKLINFKTKLELFLKACNDSDSQGAPPSSAFGSLVSIVLIMGSIALAGVQEGFAKGISTFLDIPDGSPSGSSHHYHYYNETNITIAAIELSIKLGFSITVGGAAGGMHLLKAAKHALQSQESVFSAIETYAKNIEAIHSKNFELLR